MNWCRSHDGHRGESVIRSPLFPRYYIPPGWGIGIGLPIAHAVMQLSGYADNMQVCGYAGMRLGDRRL